MSSGRPHSRPQLVEFRGDHFPALRRWIRSERQALEWGGPQVSYPVTDAMLAAMLAETAGLRPRRACWVLEQDQSAIAHAQAVFDWDAGTARLTRIIVDPTKRGRGIGQKLLAGIIDTIFGHRELHRLELNVYAHNRHAVRLYEQAGFALEGTRRAAVRYCSERWDSHLMAMLRCEYESRG